MDIKAELLKIKSYLMSSDVTTEPTEEVGETPVVEHNFAEYETATGVKVKIDGEIAVGVPVVAVAEDGTEAPAPDGEHEIVGVAKIVVKDGLIAEIMPLEEEEPKVEVEVELAEEMPIVDITAELQDRIVALEGKLDELMKRFEGMTKATEAMTAVVEEISNLPTAEVSKPASFTYLYPKSKQDKNIDKFLQALK